MLREISAKSGIFQNAATFYIFPRNMLCPTYLPPSAPLASQFARLWLSFDAPCGARLMRLCLTPSVCRSQLPLIETFRRRCIPPVKFIHIRVISTNISSISRLSINITETSISDGDWKVEAQVGHYRKSDCWHKSRVSTLGEEALWPNCFRPWSPKTLIRPISPLPCCRNNGCRNSDCLPIGVDSSSKWKCQWHDVTCVHATLRSLSTSCW